MLRLLCSLVLLSVLVVFSASPALAGSGESNSSSGGDHDIPQGKGGRLPTMAVEMGAGADAYAGPEVGLGPAPERVDLCAQMAREDNWASLMIQVWLLLSGF